MDYSLPVSSIYGIPEARILEGMPFPSPGYLPDPGIEPISHALIGGFSTSEPPGKPRQDFIIVKNNPKFSMVKTSRFVSCS